MITKLNREIMAIPLVFSADDVYTGPLGVTLTSIFINKATETELEVYVLDGQISAANKNRLNILEKTYNFSIHYLPVEAGLFRDCPENGHLKISTYFRLLAPRLIDREKIIYLDSDIIVLADLSSLFEQNLNGRTFGAVRDVTDEKTALKRKNWGLNDSFNAGVMLIDCRLWRTKRIMERVLEFIPGNKEKIEFADQDCLNYTCQNDWQEIPAKYNEQINETSPRLKKDVEIIHYIGPVKPWHIDYCGRKQGVYKKYLKKTPWKNAFYQEQDLKNLLKTKLKALLFRTKIITPDHNLGHLKLWLRKWRRN